MRRALALLACAALACAAFATGASAAEPTGETARAKKAKKRSKKRRCATKRSARKRGSRRRRAGGRCRKRCSRKRSSHRSRARRKSRRRSCRRRKRSRRGTPARPKAPRSPTGLPRAPAPAPARTPLGRYLSVAAREWSLTLSRPAVATGAVTVELRNLGEDPHNLVVSPDDGTHVPLATFSEAVPGALERRALTLSAGRYLLWCSLEGHEALGMRTTLRVGY